MSKFHGKIGYAVTRENPPHSGIWEDTIIERPYNGEEIRAISRWSFGRGVNDNVNISNSVSIVADAYAYNNFMQMRYLEFNGCLWKIESAEIQRPRLILSVGGIYNGPRPETN